MSTFTIHEPTRELTEGYFTALMKYFVVFLVAWMFGQLLIFTYPCIAWSGDKYPPTLTFLNDYHIISWILVAIGTYFYVNSQLKKHALPMITKFRFNQTQQQLELELLNLFTGKTTETRIPFSQLQLTLETKKSTWYGKEHIYTLASNGEIITRLNIEKTAWRQFPEIEGLLNQLNLHLA